MSLSSNPWLNSALRASTLGLQQENTMSGQMMGCCAKGHHQCLPPSVETSVCSVVKVVPSVIVGRFCIVQLEDGIDSSLCDVVSSVARPKDDGVTLQKTASRCLRVYCTHVGKKTLICREYFTISLVKRAVWSSNSFASASYSCSFPEHQKCSLFLASVVYCSGMCFAPCQSPALSNCVRLGTKTSFIHSYCPRLLRAHASLAFHRPRLVDLQNVLF